MPAIILAGIFFMMGMQKMGVYGTPEHIPPQKPIGDAEYYEPLHQAGESIRWVCRHCGIEYRGKYCPNCGTKAGKKRPNQLTWKITLLLLVEGWILGMLIWASIYVWTGIIKEVKSASLFADREDCPCEVRDVAGAVRQGQERKKTKAGGKPPAFL